MSSDWRKLGKSVNILMLGPEKKKKVSIYWRLVIRGPKFIVSKMGRWHFRANIWENKSDMGLPCIIWQQQGYIVQNKISLQSTKPTFSIKNFVSKKGVNIMTQQLQRAIQY